MNLMILDDMGYIEKSCIDYFDGLRTKMEAIMAQAEAIEAIDSLVEATPKKTNAGRKIKKFDDYFEETKELIKRVDNGETYYKLAYEMDLDHKTIRNRVRRVKKYLSNEAKP
jgi:DNA-binding NarL/FixJ family response regulator